MSADEKPAPAPTQLYAVEVRDAKTDALFHVVQHRVRAPSDRLAVWTVARSYGFNIDHWRLQAVPAETHFPKTEAAA